MPFQPGNQWWKARTRHGRHGKFASADELRSACEEYFEWNESNPLYEDKVSFYQGVPSHEMVEKMRVMTQEALSLFIGINVSTWREWKANKDHDFAEVIQWAESVIWQQKFSGASADLLNANIISRDLGLADKKDVQQRAVVSVDKNMSPEDAARAYQDMMNSDD